MNERIEYPVICSKCHRKSPSWKDRMKKCKLTQPDGTNCQGIFVPRNAVVITDLEQARNRQVMKGR